MQGTGSGHFERVGKMSTSECAHSNAWAGLDGCYCPDCQQTFSSGTKTYEQILKNTSRSRTREDTGPGVADNAKNSRGLDVGDRFCDSEPQLEHEHNWQSTTWTSDSRAIRVCRCGATEEISDEAALEKLLETLERQRLRTYRFGRTISNCRSQRVSARGKGQR